MGVANVSRHALACAALDCEFGRDAKAASDSLADFRGQTWRYSLFQAYARSKLANVLFADELARRHPQLGVASVHPGLVYTDVSRNLPVIMRAAQQLFAPFMLALQRLPAAGARSTLEACLAPEFAASSGGGGALYVTDGRAESPATEAMRCDTAELATRLWDASQQFVDAHAARR